MGHVWDQVQNISSPPLPIAMLLWIILWALSNLLYLHRYSWKAVLLRGCKIKTKTQKLSQVALKSKGISKFIFNAIWFGFHKSQFWRQVLCGDFSYSFHICTEQLNIFLMWILAYHTNFFFVESVNHPTESIHRSYMNNRCCSLMNLASLCVQQLQTQTFDHSEILHLKT